MERYRNRGTTSYPYYSNGSGKEPRYYQQLKTEMAQGWIVEPEKAIIKEVVTTNA